MDRVYSSLLNNRQISATEFVNSDQLNRSKTGKNSNANLNVEEIGGVILIKCEKNQFT